jgi:hypothetical protein
MSCSSIAAVQSKLLLSLFAVFSGDVTEHALTQWGYWTTVSSSRRKYAVSANLFRGISIEKSYLGP